MTTSQNEDFGWMTTRPVPAYDPAPRDTWEQDLATVPSDDDMDSLIRRPDKAPDLGLSWHREPESPVRRQEPPVSEEPPEEEVSPSSMPLAEEDFAAAAPDYTPGDPAAHAFALGEAPPEPEPVRPETSADLTSQSLVRSPDGAPTSGVRRLLYKATGGRLNLGESPAELRRRRYRAAATTHVRDHVALATLTQKGGVGKTTIAYLLGATFASLRGDRVIAMDANSDRGTLSGKVRTETAETVQDLLRDPDVRKYSDIRGYTSKGPSGLEVLASTTDPRVTAAFSAAEYTRVSDLMRRFYSISISDCGTGLVDNVISGEGGVLDHIDQLIFVSTTSVNAAKLTSSTLDWLETNGYRDLTRNAVAVVNMVGDSSGNRVDLDRLRQHFASRCRTVVEIPFDDHLATDGEIHLEMLQRSTQDSLLELAAAVGGRFSTQP